jgi:hypothetical protein
MIPPKSLIYKGKMQGKILGKFPKTISVQENGIETRKIVQKFFEKLLGRNSLLTHTKDA